jgi:hypothetical protein
MAGGRLVAGIVIAIASSACVPSYDFGPPAGGDAAADAPADAAAPAVDAPAVTDGFVRDAAAPPPADAASMNQSVVYCNQGGGVTPCPIATQGCCAVFLPEPDFCVDLANADAACVYPDAEVALVQCDEPDQCTGGQVCCAVGFSADASGAHYTGVQCMDSASCAAAGGTAECGNQQAGMFNAACTGGKSCVAFPDDYYFCN